MNIQWYNTYLIAYIVSYVQPVALMINNKEYIHILYIYTLYCRYRVSIIIRILLQCTRIKISNDVNNAVIIMLHVVVVTLSPLAYVTAL